MSPTDHSMVKIVIAGFIATLVVGRFALRSQSLTKKLLLTFLTLCFLVPTGILTVGMNPWLLDARYRTYREFYWSIRREMTRKEVMAVMKRFYPPGDARMSPIIMQDSADKLGFYMNPEDKDGPKKEAILLRMDDGRVIGADYIPDHEE